MPSIISQDSKRAILYARVSTDEQARSGYSLAQQMEALREYAAREGYEVLEEVTDPGQSGASLERPGMDRIRETVSSGGVSAVLAHDRDRISREPAYLYILKTEFEAKGCTLRALNDRGDDSPEGQLTDGIIDQLAKFEREKFKERSRRGRLRKAREGRISVTYPKYGFRFKDDNRTELVVYEPEMLIVKKLFELAAEGYGLAAICSRLSQEGIRTPRGHERWDQRAVSRSIFCDMYKPHTYSEVKELVAPEVAASLDPDKEYGIHFANRTKVTYSPISEPDGNGGKQYRKSKTIAVRPREDWIAVPVPAYLSRELVEQARGELKAHKPTERKHLTRPWELRGLIRCSCGRLMTTHTANPRKNKLYHYYTCRDRDRGAPGVGCREKSLNAIKTETRVWELISGILSNPETLKNGMERLIEQEKSRIGGGNDQERKAWETKLSECMKLRAAYQDQQAAGLMTLDELKEKLEGLEATRTLALSELSKFEGRLQRIAALEEDRDALLAQYSALVPESLTSLSSQEKNHLYRVLKIEVTPAEEGLQVFGAFGDVCTSRSAEFLASPANTQVRRYKTG